MPIETIAIIGATATVIAGFGGTFLGACLSYKVGIKLVQKTHENDIELLRRQEFNKAAAVFRAAFVDEMFRISKSMATPHAIYGERLIDIAIANEKAKIIFEVFLPDDMLSGFKVAWDKYIEADTGKNSPLTEEGRKKIATIYLSHIKNLLEFAKPKI